MFHGDFFREWSPVYLLEGVGIVIGIARLFYQSWIAVIILLPLTVPYCRRRKESRKAAGRRVLSAQFRDALESVNNALRAGDSPENAFREGHREMTFQYGKEAMISREMTKIVNGLDNQIPLERLLGEFSDRAQIEEIREFAEVFAIAKRGGGNMVEILSRSAVLIDERLEVENEIQLMLSSRRMEQRIMDVTPFLIIFYIGLTSPGFFDVLYHNPAGILFMTLCLCVYLAALYFSEKILKITV